MDYLLVLAYYFNDHIVALLAVSFEGKMHSSVGSDERQTQWLFVEVEVEGMHNAEGKDGTEQSHYSIIEEKNRSHLRFRIFDSVLTQSNSISIF